MDGVVGGKLIEKNRKYKNAMAAIALIAGLAGAIEGVIKLYPKPEPPTKAREITEIVMDRSESMGRHFDDGTRLEVAAESARNVIDALGKDDVFALREFGGPCAGENTRVLVKPGQRNQPAIQASLAGLSAGGEPSLARAVIDATGDFDNGERFKGLAKRIVVITGSRDTCSRGDPIATIRDRMARIKDNNIKLDFHFIGIGLSAEERNEVGRIAEATGATKPAFVDRRAEVTSAVRQVLVVQPVVKDAQSVVSVLNAGLAQLNSVLEAIDKRNYTEAEAGLAQARAELAKSEAPMDELGKGQRKEQFRKLYATAEENRRIRDQLVDIAGKMLEQAKSKNLEAYNASVADFNRLSGDFNQNGKAINKLLEGM
jgi:hypothetical protein